MREGQWQSERFEIFDMLLTEADQKERIARIQSEHRGAFRADERQKVTSASYQTYRHARASTITTRTIIKLISAHKLSVRLSPLLSLCIVMTSLQDASPTVNWLEGAHDQQEALI